jgi:hypothetical protein
MCVLLLSKLAVFLWQSGKLDATQTSLTMYVGFLFLAENKADTKKLKNGVSGLQATAMSYSSGHHQP